MEDIRIDVGVYTSFEVTLTQDHFINTHTIIFTVKNHPSVNLAPIIERDFSSPGIYRVTVTPEESVKLKPGAKYDFNAILNDGLRVKITDNGNIILREGVGDVIERSD